jgi:chromate transporter
MRALSPHSISFLEATRTWARIGLLSFGGPAGQIAVMHRILVEEKRWIGEQRFLHALSYCMLLPGPEAQQLATYIGWLLHGTRGGLVAGTLFILPGFVAILALSIAYVLWHQHPLMEGVFLGLKAAVIALVFEALLRIGRRALKTSAAIGIALLSFVAIAALQVPFPFIVLCAGLIGFLSPRTKLGSFAATPATSAKVVEEPPTVIDAAALTQAPPTVARAVRLLALWLPLWFVPVIACATLLGTNSVFTQIGVFFSKMATVTFGGAYAVLTYVAQQAVENFAWVTPTQMMDGLGLAESTPGPLILVLQFVGFLAAFQAAGDYPLLAGVLGAVLTVWVTFVPCFLWIFLGAPYIEALRGNAALASALSAITAAIVGVIANLALWFAVHVLFARQAAHGLPDLASLRAVPAVLTAIAVTMLFVLRWNLARVLTVSAVLGATSILLR